MTLVAVIGWIATATGMTLALPQLYRLLRTRNVEGLSLVGWQAILAVNVGWMMHGIRIGQPPQAIASGFSLIATVPILVLMSRALHRRTMVTLLPGLVLAATMVAVDQLIGSAAYGSFALVPMVIAIGGQSVALVRSPHVRGVSTPSMILGALNQGLWTTWAVLIGDPGSMISTICAGFFVTFNTVWFALRRFGVRAFFPYSEEILPAPVLVGVGVETAEA
jgi:uncharacterized protein with PQ loop repeat